MGGTSRVVVRSVSTSPAHMRSWWPMRSKATSHLAASKVTPSTPASRVDTIPMRMSPILARMGPAVR